MTDESSEKVDLAQSTTGADSDYKIIAVELQFELLKQFAWLASAIIGAIVVMLQFETITLGKQVYMALGCFAISIIVAVQGQDYMVNKLTESFTLDNIAPRMKIIRLIAFGLIAFGLGLLISAVFNL